MILAIATIISLIWFVFIALPQYVNDKNASFYFNKYIFPFQSALLLGMEAGASGNGGFGLFDCGDPIGYVKTGWNSSVPQYLQYTPFNINQWDEQGIAWLIFFGISLVFIAIVQLIFCRSVKNFIRDLISMFAVLIAGCGIALLLSKLNGLLGLVATAASIPALIVKVAIFPSIIVWLIPTSTLALMNREREARERANIKQKNYQSSYANDETDETEYTPVYVTDDDGNQYPVEMRGDYIVIRGPHGEVSTRWEYVKGQSYFDLNGSRFFPH